MSLFFALFFAAHAGAIQIIDVGHDLSRGNILIVQPEMNNSDFASAEAFASKVGSYLALAQDRGWIHSKTIAIYPEMIGGWLVGLEEPRFMYSANSLDQAMAWLVGSHLFKFVRYYMSSDVSDRAKDAVFRVKAIQISQTYHQVFKSLAKRFKVTIVAGSVILPGPFIKSGELQIDQAQPLKNVSAVFSASGDLMEPLTDKAFLTREEGVFLTAGRVESLPVYLTPLGRLGVLICADSWYPASYRVLAQKGAEFIAVPAFVHGASGYWSQPWKGYDGILAAPTDVEATDIGKITEGQAWGKYALAGRAQSGPFRAGGLSFLRGPFWNSGSDGESVGWSQGNRLSPAASLPSAIINLPI